MKGKILKACLVVIAVFALLGFAGSVDYTEAVIYNMPQSVYDGIVSEHPNLTQSEIVDYYMANKEEFLGYYCELENY